MEDNNPSFLQMKSCLLHFTPMVFYISLVGLLGSTVYEPPKNYIVWSKPNHSNLEDDQLRLAGFIGASLSEPHTSESNGGFFIYYILYIYLPYVRRSLNASWTLLTHNFAHADPCGRNIENNYVTCKPSEAP